MKETWEWQERACDLCKSSERKFLGYRVSISAFPKATPAKIYKCRKCSLIYPFPYPVPVTPNQIYTDVGSYFHSQSWSTVESASRLVADLETLLGRKGKLLDVGCGRGMLLAGAKVQGWDAEGIEISEEFASYALETYGVKGRLGNLEEQHYPGESFDIITLLSVLEHVYEPSTLVRECSRLLRRNGILYMEYSI